MQQQINMFVHHFILCEEVFPIKRSCSLRVFHRFQKWRDVCQKRPRVCQGGGAMQASFPQGGRGFGMVTTMHVSRVYMVLSSIETWLRV